MKQAVTRSNMGMPASAKARLAAVMRRAGSDPAASMTTQFILTTLLGKASSCTAASRDLCRTARSCLSSSDCRNSTV